MQLRENLQFLRQYARHPRTIGAIAPSSNVLARAMIKEVPWENVEALIEYGPGGGVFTQVILERLPPDAKFFAIEINPNFVAALKERFPEISVYHDSVANVVEICAQEGVERVDAVISGLPWAVFEDEQQTEYLDAMMNVLKDDATFITFSYLQSPLLKAGKRFKAKLSEYFDEVAASRPIWRNALPAFVYRCSGKRR